MTLLILLVALGFLSKNFRNCVSPWF